MIHCSYRITCTRCNKREHCDGGETAFEALIAAKKVGWHVARVKNGSIWEYCPECWDRDSRANIIEEVTANQAAFEYKEKTE